MSKMFAAEQSSIFYDYYKSPPLVLKRHWAPESEEMDPKKRAKINLPSLNQLAEDLNLDFNNTLLEFKAVKSLTCLNNYYYSSSPSVTNSASPSHSQRSSAPLTPYYNDNSIDTYHKSSISLKSPLEPYSASVSTSASTPTSTSPSTSTTASNSPILANSTITSTNPHQEMDAKKRKRRQRVGPSCDSCRSRKIKCNASISILSADESCFEQYYRELKLSQDQIKLLERGGELLLSNDTHNKLITSNGKLINFSSCSACVDKDKRCFFSKGFTKDDIIVYNRLEKLSPSSSPTCSTSQPTEHYPLVDDSVSVPEVNQIDQTREINHAVQLREVLEPGSIENRKNAPNLTNNTRKSSCLNCRKRKVKCVMVDLGKSEHDTLTCENCIKKGMACVVEHRKK